MRKKIGNIIKFVFFVGLGIFFIYWFLSKLTSDEKAQIWQAFDNVNYFGWRWCSLPVCLATLYERCVGGFCSSLWAINHVFPPPLVL